MISLETVVVTEGPDVLSGEVHGCVQEGVADDGPLEANWRDVPGGNRMGLPGLGGVLGEVVVDDVPCNVSGTQVENVEHCSINSAGRRF